jgi:DNA-binding NtrC family response regulator
MNSLQAATLLPHAFRVATAVSRPSAEPLGDRSLKEIVDSAIAAAEARAIRRALTLTRGNKSQAARILRTNYTTLHGKMKRLGISVLEFRPA